MNTETQEQTAAAATAPTQRIDLNREDQLVPWAEWFVRADIAMNQYIGSDAGRAMLPPGVELKATPEGLIDFASLPFRKIFRVTLTDGRVFATLGVQHHVAKGKCNVGTDRWGNTDATCDVITGYTLIGTANDGLPSTMTITPCKISSVECVLLPKPGVLKQLQEAKQDPQDDNEAFGFARYASLKDDPQIQELEEPI